MSQIGDSHNFTNLDEATSAAKVKCPKCQTYGVPRGITSTRPGGAGEQHCLYCGHIYGRDAQVE